MLTEEQILAANELFASAVNYNMAMQSAFVSTDDMVTCKLTVGGKQQSVTIPTWHHILTTVNKLANTVKSMQVSDDGHDVVQLLSQGNQLQLLYLQRKQYYVQKPLGAVIDKFDDETVPTCYSASNKTAMYVNLSACDLPMDATYAIVQLDDDQPMRLPILYKTTCFDKVSTILSVDEDGVLVDQHSLAEGDTVQVNCTLYNVVSVLGNVVKLASQSIATSDLAPGDEIYTITDAVEAYVEVPLVKQVSKMKLQIQYMKLLSAAAEYDIADEVAAGIHAGKQTALKHVLSGKTAEDIRNIVNTASVALPANLSEIVAASKPTISNINITQVNAHQYINSTVEQLQTANAALELAKADIDRYEQLLASPSLSSDMILQYKEQLASAQTRYAAAQADINALRVSAQNVSPEYEATIYASSVDAEDKPVMQYVVRYQRLSYDVKELTDNWRYAYSVKRQIDYDGSISSDIDDYSVNNFVRIPIRAYEQLAVQIAAILSYGQPHVTIQTDWSDTVYTQIPTNILKEQSVEDMFKNAYEAKIYSGLQQAMQAAGVYSHIDLTKTYAHKAADIQYDSSMTLLDKLSEITQNIAKLTDVSNAAQNIAVQLIYNGKTYNVTNGSTIEIEIEQSYCTEVFANMSPEQVEEALGTIVEHNMQLKIINNGVLPALFSSVIAGMPTEPLNGTILNYCNVGIKAGDAECAQTYGQAAYAAKSNRQGSQQLVYDHVDNAGYDADAYGSNVDHPYTADIGNYNNGQGKLSNVRGLGITNSATGLFNFQNAPNHSGVAFHIGWPFNTAGDALNANKEFSSTIDAMTDVETKTIVASILAATAQHPINLHSKNNVQLGYYKYSSVAIGSAAASKIATNVITKPWFDASDKYTSGMSTRGAALFFSPESVGDIRMNVYGITNALSIDPGEAKALVLPITWQCRMTDRLGVADGHTGAVILNNGHLSHTSLPSQLTYQKAMSIHLNIGNADFCFDLIVKQNYD